MLLELGIVGGLVYVALRTRPTPESFSKFYEQRSGHNSFKGGRIFGLFDRLLGGRTLPTFQFTNLYVGWLVQVSETGQLFIGIFGVWISLCESNTAFINGPEKVELERVEGMTAVDKASRIQNEAHELKAKGNYAEAARKYEKAAQEAENQQDTFSAAEMLDEAARCLRMAGDLKGYETFSIQAASLFQKKGRNIRAATLYEKLARYQLSIVDKNQNEEYDLLRRASEYFKQAQNLFQVEHDGRSESLKVDLLHILARLGEFEEAAEGFRTEAERIIANDLVLLNQSQRMLLFSLLCWWASNDDKALFCRKTREFRESFTWFTTCREGQWAAQLSQAISNSESIDFKADRAIEVLEHELRMMASMPPWFNRTWEALKNYLSSVQPELV